MKIFNLTLKYMGRNGVKLIPFLLAPALALAVSGSLSSMMFFFMNFAENSTTLLSIYVNFSLFFETSWLLGVLAFFIIVFFMSMEFGAIERHMKIGKFSITKAVTKINETILAVFPVSAIIFLGIELFAFVLSLLISLYVAVFGQLAIYFSIFTVFLLLFLLCLCLSLLTLVIPSALVVGYNIPDSIGYSLRIISKVEKEIVLSIITVIIIEILLSFMSHIIFKSQIVNLVIDFIISLVGLIFACSFSMVSYYEVSNEPRRDREVEKKSYLT